MKGKIIRNLRDYNGKTVWVEFGEQITVGCANDHNCGLGDAKEKLYTSGLYRVEGHFLISQKDKSISLQEFTPDIIAICEWYD